MKKLLNLVFIVAAVLSAAACNRHKTNYTVIVSLDGFRWDYPQKFDMPFMDSLAKVGVKANMSPSFPSSTFPNHFTLATGLVPDHHGLVSNNFWNPALNHSYSMRDPESRYNPDYYSGEPVWATAQRQGEITGAIY